MSDQPGTGVTPADVAPARPAATVILARPTLNAFEVFLVRRTASVAAFADVYVFPGGTTRPDDSQESPGDADFSPEQALTELTRRGGTAPESAAQAIALYRTALRELFEEAGVLLARTADGQTLGISGDRLETYAGYRRALQQGRLRLPDLLARERLALDYRALRYFSHWITPAGLSRRFDTRFFLAAMPADQTALPCQVETTDGVWIRPSEALARAATGRLGLVFPTRLHLERIGRLATLTDLLAFASRKAVRTVQPDRSLEAGSERITLPAGLGECW